MSTGDTARYRQYYGCGTGEAAEPKMARDGLHLTGNLITPVWNPETRQQECGITRMRSRHWLRKTEAMFILHHSPNHYNGVISIGQDKAITLIWCDSMQYEGSSALQIYAQYYHFVEGLTRPQAFKQTRHYTSSLDIRRRCPQPPRQENGTDCGNYTLMYQQALSKWYGDAPGHDFTEEWIEKLTRELQAVTQSKVQDHRTWLHRTMHTWWTHTVQNDNMQVPPTVRRQQREKWRR
jgi:hypothetical protein